MIGEKEENALVATLGRVSSLLVVCAPPFAEGSEGARTVEIARQSIRFAQDFIKENADRKDNSTATSGKDNQ